MSKKNPAKRKYSALRLAAAMQLVPVARFTAWPLAAASRPPSDVLLAHLGRLKVFDTETTKTAKTLLMDALFAEIVPHHANLKVWKSITLETDEPTGVADYVIAPDYAYLAMPLLCVAEAKRDDFVQGRAQYMAEMTACQWNNRERKHDIDVYGIVSNVQGWQFYQLTPDRQVLETDLYNTKYLPELLGALDYVCAACARNVLSA